MVYTREQTKSPILEEQNFSPTLFLHCVDSRLNEIGSWYSRMHLGPFRPGSRIQVGNRLRRSLLNDLRRTTITAVEVEGAIHEFSLLTAIQEPVLDLLFNFRKINLHSSLLKYGEVLMVPFLFSGARPFRAKDIPWPSGIQCRNPSVLVASLSPGTFLRGHLLVQKCHTPNFVPQPGQPFHLNRYCYDKKMLRRTVPKRFSAYPWLSIGFPSAPVERVGFRIEPLGPLNQQLEILIIEILTNGSISPHQALREAALLLVYKFSAVAKLRLPHTTKIRHRNIWKGKLRERSLSSSTTDTKSPTTITSDKKQTFYNLFDGGLNSFLDPLGLDLGILDLDITRYHEMRSLGISTVGQLIEILAFKSYCFPPLLRRKRQKSLFRLGFFSSVSECL